MRKKHRRAHSDELASNAPLTPEQAIALLRQECNILLSRVSAILDCPEAIDSLAAQDVFGNLIESLLREDKESLQAVLEKTRHLAAEDTVTSA